VAFTPTGFGSIQLTVGAAGVVIGASTQQVLVGVRRFSSTFGALGTIAKGARDVLSIRPDLAPEPWHVELASTAPLRACGLG